MYTAQDIQAWAPPVYPFAKLDPRWHEAGAVRVSWAGASRCLPADAGLAFNCIQQADFSQVHFAAIMVFHDSRDWGRDIQLMCDVLRSRDGVVGNVGDDTHPQVPLFFSHGDLREWPVVPLPELELTLAPKVWGNDFHASRFGQGAFQHAVAAVYKATSGRDLVATTFGKPERGTYEYAHERLRARAAELGHEAGELNTWMVGDNPASDIAGERDAAVRLLRAVADAGARRQWLRLGLCTRPHGRLPRRRGSAGAPADHHRRRRRGRSSARARAGVGHLGTEEVTADTDAHRRRQSHQ